MRILLLLFVIVVGAALVYKYMLTDDIPMALQQAITNQANPFTVPTDSGNLVWKRASQLLEGRKRLLSGGKLIQTDSTLFLPYYNDSHKGGSILIQRKPVNDSVVFTVSWWQHNSLSENGSKEIALFMQKGISRYNNHF